MPDDTRLPSPAEIHARMPRGVLNLIDLLTDGWKLMRDREDIRRAVSEAIDAGDVAAHSLEVAGRDLARATEKLRAAKELIVTATD